MKRSKSSSRWLADHEDDEYVKKARVEGYRSRASYKLLEIDEKYQILRSGLTVIDLGAAPGGWSQVASKRVGSRGKVIALDLLEMPPIQDVSFIQGDFTEDRVLEELMEVMEGSAVDLVISDMAPNLSGVKDIDQPRSVYLVELALDFAVRVLNKNGVLVVKCFEGEGIDDIRQMFRASFRQVINFKPKASRGRSREIYILGRGFMG
jgi:23S rRNA (uridine2552-2'-O)-methyltransferase